MPTLRGLSVSCLNVEDAGIATLPSFPALRELMPMDVPDAGYRHIGKCAELESLVLMYCRDTTDAATEHIPGCRNSRTISTATRRSPIARRSCCRAWTRSSASRSTGARG